MKLKAFRIQNFRSIKDTGWQELSSDNITAIVGQNESGKTSILEALEAFDSNHITGDDIRNDNSSPIVTCTFCFEDENIKNFLDENIPENYDFYDSLVETIQELEHCVTLQKTWDVKKLDDEPILEIINEELIDYFKVLEEELHYTEMAEASETTDETSETTDEAFETTDEASETTDEASETTDETSASEKELLTLDSFAEIIYNCTPLITLFKDESLLPSKIDIVDLEKKNEEAEGYIGAQNFLYITELTVNELKNHQLNERMVKDKIGTVNEQFSEHFRKFWSQSLGTKDKISIEVEVKNYDQTNESKVGQSYLSFWIKDKNGNLGPAQRSKGLRWFISFFLTLKATVQEYSNRIMLIDETGANLHATAQEDILKILESEKENMQIVYATHSPYLIDVEKVYRVLVVERKDINNDNKTVTKVYKPQQGASRDTLFPIYTAMGVDISHQQVIKKTNNIILEEISALYYFQAFWKLFDKEKEAHFLPTNGCSNIPLLANLLLGWGIQFSVVVDDEKKGREVIKKLIENKVLPEERLIKIKDCDGIEDLFSKEDFAKLILTGATEEIPDNKKISRYVKDEKLSKPILAYEFLIKVEKEAIKKDDLSQVTQQNIDKLLNKIVESL